MDDRNDEMEEDEEKVTPHNVARAEQEGEGEGEGEGEDQVMTPRVGLDSQEGEGGVESSSNFTGGRSLRSPHVERSGEGGGESC